MQCCTQLCGSGVCPQYTQTFPCKVCSCVGTGTFVTSVDTVFFVFVISGSYVIQITEATAPPLLNKLLPPVYIEMKVLSRKVSSGETSLDKLLNKNRSKTKQQSNIIRHAVDNSKST